MRFEIKGSLMLAVLLMLCLGNYSIAGSAKIARTADVYSVDRFGNISQVASDDLTAIEAFSLKTESLPFFSRVRTNDSSYICENFETTFQGYEAWSVEFDKTIVPLNAVLVVHDYGNSMQIDTLRDQTMASFYILRKRLSCEVELGRSTGSIQTIGRIIQLSSVLENGDGSDLFMRKAMLKIAFNNAALLVEKGVLDDVSRAELLDLLSAIEVEGEQFLKSALQRDKAIWSFMFSKAHKNGLSYLGDFENPDILDLTVEEEKFFTMVARLEELIDHPYDTVRKQHDELVLQESSYASKAEVGEITSLMRPCSQYQRVRDGNEANQIQRDALLGQLSQKN